MKTRWGKLAWHLKSGTWFFEDDKYGWGHARKIQFGPESGQYMGTWSSGSVVKKKLKDAKKAVEKGLRKLLKKRKRK